MKVLALISGGKDSIYNLCRCMDEGHEVVALGNLYNCCIFIESVEEGQEGYETDSYMYQTVGTNATLAIAQAL
jgi:diphthine-ammonia ligase